uniref:Gypsy retrotransposon integrase-like protein 1 n=1 Tax=Paramormyrops kingsleyae TaxID=1676925 RepID=A0A3B3RUB2_9TELE
MMPMGITNAPPSFQRLMELVLRGLHWSVCLIYLDDIIVYSKDFEQHLQHLRDVFHRFRAAGLKLKPSKCHLARSSVSFLGHHVSHDGVRPDPSNTEKVANWPLPESPTQVRAFLGLCSYYRRFIKHFAHIAEPLHHLTRKGVPFVWSFDADQAFRLLKLALTSPPVMAFPNLSVPFLLHTDASLHAIGSVLSQLMDGKERVIAYASHVLSASEKKWSTFDRELFAVVWSVRHFRHYVAYSPLTIVTDHKPLVGLHKIPLDHDPTGRRARWAVELDIYDWHIIHRNGAKHQNADAMSRRPPDAPVHSSSNTLSAESFTQTTNSAPTSSVSVQTSFPNLEPVQVSVSPCFTNLVRIDTDLNIAEAQKSDPDLLMARRWVEEGHRPPLWRLRHATPFLRKLWSQFKRLCVQDGLLCYHSSRSPADGDLYQAVVPSALIPSVLQSVHGHPTTGHYGLAKTLDRATRLFYWPYMSTDISRYCECCPACQSRRSPVPRPQAPLLPISPDRPFQLVAADITELPLSTMGNRYVLVLMDLYTKFVNLYPLKDQTAISVAKCIFELFLPQHGVPEALHSDQGRQFESDLIKHLCHLLSIRKIRTSPYHAQCDGAVERYNRTLKDELAKHLFQLGQEWDVHLPLVALAYNTTVHTSTGFTPFFLAHGREARMPLDLLRNTAHSHTSATAGTPAAYAASLCSRLVNAFESAAAFRDKAQAKQRFYYDRRLNYNPYKPGQLVLLDDPAHQRNKLAPRWTGPFEVVRAIQPPEHPLPVNFQIRALSHPGAKLKIVHYNGLKPYIPGPTADLTRPVPDNPSTPSALPGLLPCVLRPVPPSLPQHADPLGPNPSVLQQPDSTVRPRDGADVVVRSLPSLSRVTVQSAAPPQEGGPPLRRALPQRQRHMPRHLQDFVLRYK